MTDFQDDKLLPMEERLRRMHERNLSMTLALYISKNKEFFEEVEEIRYLECHLRISPFCLETIPGRVNHASNAVCFPCKEERKKRRNLKTINVDKLAKSMI